MTDFKEFFSKNADSYANSLSHKKGEDLSQLMAALEPAEDQVAIDLASGTGFTAIELSAHVSRVVAYDGTKEMLDKARALAEEGGAKNIEYLIGDVSNLPFPDETFDIITCRRAAHHFTDKEKFLSEAFRVMRKGGRLGLVDMAVPEADNDNVFNHIEIIRDSSHVSAEKLGAWKGLIMAAGFQIKDIISSREEYTIEGWLSPVKMESGEGTELQRYIRETPEELLRKANINREDGKIVKERFVLIAEKP